MKCCNPGSSILKRVGDLISLAGAGGRPASAGPAASPLSPAPHQAAGAATASIGSETDALLSVSAAVAAEIRLAMQEVRQAPEGAGQWSGGGAVPPGYKDFIRWEAGGIADALEEGLDDELDGGVSLDPSGRPSGGIPVTGSMIAGLRNRLALKYLGIDFEYWNHGDIR